MTSPQKESTRLRRSVKRRRQYADDLKKSSHSLRETDPAFSDRLLALADSELALARDETSAAEQLEGVRHCPVLSLDRQEQREMAERAIRTLTGSFVSDRISALMRDLAIENPLALGGHDALCLIEMRLGLPDVSLAKPGARPPVGERLRTVEAAAAIR